ncbi:helix-turn-helix transcriptional regulator [Herbaspirillum sp. 1130]|jgi:Helix-turn-helix.|uniref:helix-turn-helix domain-containing protein n=1 Tax=Herbaspirillum sp. 1130 TaxID=2806562 RepID=UPI001AEA11C7|nr:helix-turn-helix transcriptional regulator [Herbaspirillum sp. 1130]MBP1317784.1 transcriptional regulator with XRE-family HTH domain [Herbaspirillum sp. 1130]
MSNKKVIDLTSFGARLREERLRLGFNQTDFAEIGGVQKDGQVKYEAGKREPGIGYIALLAQAGVDVGFLISGLVSTAATDDEMELLFYYRQLDTKSKSSVLGLADSLRPMTKEVEVDFSSTEIELIKELAEKAGVSVEVMLRRMLLQGAYELAEIPPQHRQKEEVDINEALRKKSQKEGKISKE